MNKPRPDRIHWGFIGLCFGGPVEAPQKGSEEKKVAEEPSQVESGIHPKLTNPLSQETRKERVYLLAMSAIGITIVFTGLIPTEITTLGIKFAEADRKSLLFIFAFVVGYFLVAFASYALSDYLAWARARRDLALRMRRSDLKSERANIQQELDRMASERETRACAGGGA
jgi:hypothetical protein